MPCICTSTLSVSAEDATAFARKPKVFYKVASVSSVLAAEKPSCHFVKKKKKSSPVVLRYKHRTKINHFVFFPLVRQIMCRSSTGPRWWSTHGPCPTRSPSPGSRSRWPVGTLFKPSCWSVCCQHTDVSAHLSLPFFFFFFFILPFFFPICFSDWCRWTQLNGATETGDSHRQVELWPVRCGCSAAPVRGEYYVKLAIFSLWSPEENKAQDVVCLRHIRLM